MGAWGSAAWDNDDAADWFGALFAATELAARVEKTLKTIPMVSKVTRSAEIPLAAHALTAVKEAVADSGLEMSDVDGLATYPELPATDSKLLKPAPMPGAVPLLPAAATVDSVTWTAAPYKE